MLASLLSENIICVKSALFYYSYSDFAPRQWSIAVPRTFSRTKLKTDSLAIKVYFIQPAQFEIGKTTRDFNGRQLAVYDRERTICDCFKYLTKIDNEMFSKAINAYAADEKKNKRERAKLSTLFSSFLPRGSFMPFVEIQVFIYSVTNFAPRFIHEKKTK